MSTVDEENVQEPPTREMRLSALPTDILLEIIQRIAYPSLLALYAAGDPSLNGRLRRGGVKSLYLKLAAPLPVFPWPSILSQLHSLRHLKLYIIKSGVPSEKPMLSLPRSLESLDLNLLFLRQLLEPHLERTSNSPTLSQDLLKLILPNLSALDVTVPQKTSYDAQWWIRLCASLPSSLTKLRFAHGGPVWSNEHSRHLPNLETLDIEGPLKYDENVILPLSITSLTVRRETRVRHIAQLANLSQLSSLSMAFSSEEDADLEAAKTALCAFPQTLTTLHLSWAEFWPDDFFAMLPRGLLELRVITTAEMPAEKVSNLPKGLKRLKILSDIYSTVVNFKTQPDASKHGGDEFEAKRHRLVEYYLNLPRGLEEISGAAPSNRISELSVIEALPRSLLHISHLYFLPKSMEYFAALPPGLRSVEIAHELALTEIGLAHLPRSLRLIIGNFRLITVHAKEALRSFTCLTKIGPFELDGFAELEKNVDAGSNEPAPSSGAPNPVQGARYVHFSSFMPPMVTDYNFHVREAKSDVVLDFAPPASSSAQIWSPMARIESLLLRNLLVAPNTDFILHWQGLQPGCFASLTEFTNRVYQLDRSSWITFVEAAPRLQKFAPGSITFALEDENLEILSKSLQELHVKGPHTNLTHHFMGRLPRPLRLLSLPASPNSDWKAAKMTLKQMRLLMPPHLALCDVPLAYGSFDSVWFDLVNKDL